MNEVEFDRLRAQKEQILARADANVWLIPCGGDGSESISVTKEGALAINCGGSVHIRPIKEWHGFADAASNLRPGTATIVLPRGYKDAEEFAKDCGFELAAV